MRVSTLLASFATLALFDVALAGRHGGPSWRRHSSYHSHSSNEGGNTHSYAASKGVQKVTGEEFQLSKRVDNGRFSFYDAGLGACGKVNSGSDFIVALNSAQFDSGDYCFKKISITVNGKTAEATVTDRCPGCPPGGLDFSRGLFNFFAAESVGIIHGSWDFGGAPPPPAPPPPPPVVSIEIKKAKPSPSPAPPPPPPPPPPPKPSPSPEPEPTTVVSTSIKLEVMPSSTTSVSSSSTSATSSSATPTATSTPAEDKHKGCLENLDLAMAHLGAMVVAGSENSDNRVSASSSDLASVASASIPSSSASISASASGSPSPSAPA